MAGATKAVQAKENKVEFGLRNCYYAVVTVDESGKSRTVHRRNCRVR